MVTLILAVLAFLTLMKLFGVFGKVKFSIKDEQLKSECVKKMLIKTAQNDENALVADKEVLNLQERFHDFSAVAFLGKAEEVFDSIFNAFANSHHHTLKSMLTDDLYESFAERINKREDRNLRQEILIKHKKTSIEKVKIMETKACVLVSFAVEQMSAMIDTEGKSFDNPMRLYRNVLHKWLFERFYSSSSWLLTNISSAER
ncbi:hypothetical protein FACS1894113_3200 [Alphaproteobacteria bacterium]|nr:hypothetical protein FACS1894113_3200 [Alphaproteobacteria bacterium]